MNVIADNLAYRIADHLVDTTKESYINPVTTIVENYPYESREANTQRLAQLLQRKVPKPYTGRGARKLEGINRVIGDDLRSKVDRNEPVTIVDFGAGKGEVTEALADYYANSINPNLTTVYAVELKPLPPSPKYIHTVIEELEDKSVDLIVVIAVLHHVHPADRRRILGEFDRVLKEDGKIVIEEHASNGSTGFYMSLDIYHNFWYIVEKEDYDPLYLMSAEETAAEFSRAGFQQSYRASPEGWQALYVASFDRKI